jgi:hypothetical protein
MVKPTKLGRISFQNNSYEKPFFRINKETRPRGPGFGLPPGRGLSDVFDNKTSLAYSIPPFKGARGHKR